MACIECKTASVDQRLYLNGNVEHLVKVKRSSRIFFWYRSQVWCHKCLRKSVKSDVSQKPKKRRQLAVED